MSDDLAREIEESYQVKDNRQRRQSFLARMEHKLHTKERRYSQG